MGREDFTGPCPEAVGHGLATGVDPLLVAAAVDQGRVPEVTHVPHGVFFHQEGTTRPQALDYLYGQALLIDGHSLERPSRKFDHLVSKQDALTRCSHARFEVTHVVQQVALAEQKIDPDDVLIVMGAMDKIFTLRRLVGEK